MKFPKCYIMIGLPGSGKDYLINSNKKENDIVVSSDKLREELFGDINDQKHNNEVFNEMFKRTVAALKNGQNVYYNATNINRKRRINLIKEIKNAVKKTIAFYAIVIATPYEKCLGNNNKRDRKVPEEVIKKMLFNYQPPAYQEGFNYIKFIRNYSFDIYLLLKKSQNISHRNPHHKLTIGDHMLKSAEYIRNYCHEYNLPFDYYMFYICIATEFHDIGKPMTQIQKDGICHYYNHHNVGAYIISCSEFSNDDNTMVLISNLIYHHMDYFDENKIKKTKQFFHNDSIDYYDLNRPSFEWCLDLLHCADSYAH